MKRFLATVFAVGVLACMESDLVPQRKQYPEVPESELKGVVRTRLDHPNPTPDQLARREQSIAALERLGVPHLATLPVTEDPASLQPRSATEVASRCIAMAICAVKGETRDQELTDELIARFDANEFFSPREMAFIRNPRPAEQELIDAAWGYEVVHTLLWSLGYVDQLKPPNEICDVVSDVAIIRERGKELAAGARLRSTAEILDQADLYYHLHWSAIELRIRGQSSPHLDEGIIRERHRALNWLIRYMNQAWDEVQTDTYLPGRLIHVGRTKDGANHGRS